jgi:uncharacterized protein YqeY
MSALLARLQSDLTAARKGGEKARTLVLGTLLADVKNREIEVRRALSDDDVMEVIGRGIKKRRESIALYAKAGREDLAERERAEVRVLEDYLPAPAGADELRAAVQAAIAAGAANIGAVMGAVMPQFRGRAEGGAISAIAREELGKRG